MSRIVGSVGLKVQPDTSGFKKEADAKLKEVDLDPIKVEIEPDGDELLRKSKKAARDTSRRLKTDGDDVKLPVSLRDDDDKLLQNARGVIRRTSAALKRAGVSIKIPLEVDTSKIVDQVEKGINKALAKIREKGALEVGIKVNVDLDRADDDIDDFIRHNNGRQIDLDVGLDHEARIHAQLAALARDRRTKITPTLDKRAYATVLASLKALSGLNVVQDFTKSLRNLAQNSDRFAISAAKLGVIIGGLTTLGLTTFGGLSVLAGNLLQLGGAALALPAAGVALASFVTIGVAAFKNFKDAVGGSAEAMAQLPENAQAAALALQGVWGEIQRPVQSSFWMGVGRSIERTVDPIVSSLSRGLSRVAEPLGESFANVLSGVSDIARSGLMDKMFANLAKGVQNANRGIAPFMRAIGTIGDRASQNLPKVGTYLTKIGEKFERWVNAAADTGRMDDWLTNAFKRFGQIGDVIGGVVGGFSAINDAARAAGFGGMDYLVQKAQDFRNLMEDFRTQTALREMFSGAQDAMDRFKEGLRPLGTAIADFAPTFANLLRSTGTILGSLSKSVGAILDNPRFRDGVNQFFKAVGDGLIILEKYAPSVGSLFGSLLGSAGELFKNLSPAFGVGLQVVATAFERLAPAVSSLSSSLGGALMSGLSLLNTLIPPIALAAEAFAGAVSLIPSPLVAAGTAMLLFSKAMGGALLVRLAGFTRSLLTLGSFGGASRAADAVDKLRNNIGKIAAGVGIAAAVTGLVELSTNAQAVQQSADDAAKAVQDLAKMRIKNPLEAGTGKDEIAKANEQADQLLQTMGRVAEVPQQVKSELAGNRQGLIDLYLGNPTEAANKAKALLTIARGFAREANSTVGDFAKETFSFGAANTLDRNVLEQQATDYINAASKISDAQKQLLGTDAGKVEQNLGVLAGAVVKFGEVTPDALDRAGTAILDMTGAPLKGIDAFSTALASKIGGSKDEIASFAAAFKMGFEDIGTSPQALVRIATKMGLPTAKIRELLESIGRTGDEVSKDMEFSFGAVTDVLGKTITVAGDAVPKLSPLSDGMRELGDAVASVTDVDSATLTRIFETLGTSPDSVARGLAAAGVSAEKIKAVLTSMGVSAITTQQAVDRVVVAQQNLAKANLGGGWNAVGASNYGKALEEIGKSGDTAAQKVEALKRAIDVLNGGQLSTEQATADLNAAVDNVGASIDGVGGQVVQADGSIKKVAATTQDWAKVLNSTTGQIDTTTEAGRNLFGSITDLSTKSMTAAQTAFDTVFSRTGDYKLATEAATKATEGQARSLVTLLKNAGLTDKQIGQLLDRYNLFPDKIVTDVLANTAAANSDIGKVLGLLNNYEDPRNVQLGALDDQAVAVLKSMGIELTRYEDGTYSANLGATDDEARGKVRDLAAWVQSQEFTASVSFNSWKNDIGTIYLPVVASITSFLTFGASSANGNIFSTIAPGRMVKAFANGGVENHTAKIYRSTSMTPIRIFAEPETGGEAYIPLAASKRPRSEQILNQVATLFGKRLVDINNQSKRYADGGTSPQIVQTTAGSGFNLTINNPQAEPTSVTLDRAQQFASLIGTH